MTAREKAFVINGMRTFMTRAFNDWGLPADEVAPRLMRFANSQGISFTLLEETRKEQQLLVQALIHLFEGD